MKRFYHAFSIIVWKFGFTLILTTFLQKLCEIDAFSCELQHTQVQYVEFSKITQKLVVQKVVLEGPNLMISM